MFTVLLECVCASSAGRLTSTRYRVLEAAPLTFQRYLSVSVRTVQGARFGRWSRKKGPAEAGPFEPLGVLDWLGQVPAAEPARVAQVALPVVLVLLPAPVAGIGEVTLAAVAMVAVGDPAHLLVTLRRHR